MEIQGVTYCGKCADDENKQNRLKSHYGNEARTIHVKGRYCKEHEENDPSYSRKVGKTEDKLVKFYPRDPNCSCMQMKRHF